jgi:hypothetical protein
MTRFLPSIVFLVTWLLLTFGGGKLFLRDPGTHWHTIVGQKILDEGFFSTDPFTFTHHGQKWIPHQWLGEVMMAISYQHHPDMGSLMLVTAILSGLLTYLLMRFLEIGLHPLLALLFIGLVVATAATHFHVRPHIATMVGMAVTMVVLTSIDRGDRPWTRLAVLIPAYILWTNTHGGMLGGLLTMGIAGVGWTLQLLLGGRSPLTNWRSVFGLLGLGLACGATMFVTPYGTEIPLVWLQIMDMPSLPSLIVEHAPPDWSQPTAWPLAILTLLYIALLLGVPIREWRGTWFLPLFWALQAYGRVRHAPLFAFLACIAACDIWSHTRYARWLSQNRPDLYPWPKSVTSPWNLVVIVMLIIGGFMSIKMIPIQKEIGIDSPLSGERVFNEYDYGGLLIKQGCQVFVDDRCELFGDPWLKEFIETSYAEPDVVEERMNAWRERYGTYDWAVVNQESSYGAYFLKHSDVWVQIGERPDGSTCFRRKALNFSR